MLDDLYNLWFAHLWDNIPSVREDTALALGNVVTSYGQEALDRIVPMVNFNMPRNGPTSSCFPGTALGQDCVSYLS